MKLVIAGASGFIGSVLVQRLGQRGDALVLLSRKPRSSTAAPNTKWLVWEPGKSGGWEESIDGADGIVNLAGAGIADKRWTERQKEIIRSSRIDSSRALVRAIAKAKTKPQFLINASAVGYYGSRGDETLTEESAPGKDYLAEVCVAWETEAKRAQDQGVRVALVRTGIVLGKGKGALAKMVTPFKFFAGGPLGSGKQWMPWIHIEDEVGLILFLIDNAKAQGSFNATAPNPVTMEEFCKALGQVLNRPSWATVPESVLALLLGEMADMVLGGQRALPKAAETLGYKFKHPTVTEALESLGL
ncbi:MAG TPA: TIGR01777 family oxidoreductase [Candidatus Binatia bacterium]|nr:TIGR01777 family oxidoreductase [Candidatus Binatia bacterium]